MEKIMINDDNINECPYRINEPYPPVRVVGPNPVYACSMLGNIASIISEMSDIVRYSYIAVVTKPKYSWISKCFHDVSIVEMYHLNIFSELALLLGADPRLWVCSEKHPQWWSPSFISYPRELRALVEESIKAEKAAIRKYSKEARNIRDTNIVAILNRIIRDEEHHLQIFNEIYRQI